jgi:hypothetical protein
MKNEKNDWDEVMKLVELPNQSNSKPKNAEITRLTVVLLAFAGSLVSPLPFAFAGTCTPGSTCYCDRVKNGDLKDQNLLMCEDFEAPTLHPAIGQESAGFGNGAPYYGPPWDHSDPSYPYNRGSNQYWFKIYGNGVSGAHIRGGSPDPATFGITCGKSGNSLGYNGCWGHAFWDAGDRWQANSYARKAIFTDSDFSIEVPTIQKPAGRAGGGNGVFDGQQSFASRITTDVNGIQGAKKWPATREMGITQAVAYPNNTETSGALSGPWKGNEWESTDVVQHGLFMFHYGPGARSSFPFYGSMMQTPPFGPMDACKAALAGATVKAGTFQCNGNGIIWFPTNYKWPDDWPLGTWGCARGHYRNIGLSNMAWTIYFTSPNDGVERVVIDIANFDGRFLYFPAGGITAFVYNAYNNNAAANTQTTLRYEDNIHVRSGAPVTCGQIGFNASAPAPAPTPTADTTPPTVTITAPVNGAVVKIRSSVTVKASAFGNIAVNEVEIFIDGATKCTDSAAPYECIWQMPKWAGRTYGIPAKAYDFIGNVAPSSFVNVLSARWIIAQPMGLRVFTAQIALRHFYGMERRSKFVLFESGSWKFLI